MIEKKLSNATPLDDENVVLRRSDKKELANVDLSNITDAGKEVIKENSGGFGLEVGDIAFTQGAIDETKGLRRVLNGSVVTQNSNTQGFFNWFTTSVAQNPNMATTEAEWQSENTANGMCGKFVYTAGTDSEAATLRLPNYPKYFIGNVAATAPVVGNGKSFPLSDGVVSFGTTFFRDPGSFRGLQSDATIFGSSNATSGAAITNYPGNYSILGVPTAEQLGDDLSKSGLVANIPAPYKIAGTYFIQIATGQETEVNITNEIELNNPFFFGMYQYFEAEPNNLSWLKSAGQWNSKAVYPDYYNWLLQEKNNPSTLPASANVEITGSLINNNGVLSGFGESNYAEIPQAPSDIESLELVFKFTTGDDITTRQSVYGQTITNIACPQCIISGSEANMSLLEVLLGLDADTWGTPIYSTSTVSANTTYTTKVIWDNTSKNMVFSLKTEDGDFIQQGALTQNTVYWTEPMRIGLDMNSYPGLGTIDLNECYININGSRWWSGMTNGVKFSTEDYSDYDYVINTSDETFKLPTKTKINPVSGGTIPVVGNGKALGLTNGTQFGGLMYSDEGSQRCFPLTALYGASIPTSNPSISEMTNKTAFGVPTLSQLGDHPEYSGLEANIPTLNDIYLYFYVGETVQNANLIDAGRFAEQLTDINKAMYYASGDSYIFGDCNYCGALSSSSTLLFFTVLLPKSLKYISSITCSKMIISARKPTGGYVESINWDALTNATIHIIKRGEYLLDIRIIKGSAYSETNNIPLSVQVDGTFVFS